MTGNPSPEALFQLALEFSDPQERVSFLDRACAGNEALRKEVDALLAAFSLAGAFLERTAGLEEQLLAEKPGDRIGRYKLLEKIGEGGFGDVWMAGQQEPMRRKVALKIVKLGMDTREVLARFEAERQALALMDHLNIARVFDGGATDSGRPYFVMELVRGLPITEFCDARKMPPPERLDLFRKVCLAVQHAHQKGIIHRDLKPSNILVTVQDDQPVPKVIDFGIAKALQTHLTEQTLFTRFNQWLGTPAYMSPEQAGLGGLDVDTRSDVYSLGAILYELLTGHPPIDEHGLRDKGYDAILRALREEEPQKASTRLTGLSHDDLKMIARQRGRTSEQLQRTVKGELDWILLKALERDRSRRYETANALARDLERFNDGEPVTAVPPRLSYQAGKFFRKHWKTASVVVAFIGLLAAGTLTSVRQAMVARKARDAAVTALDRAKSADNQRRIQLQEAARSDRLQALELLEGGRERDAFAFLARACGYDPTTTLAAESAVFYLNTLDFPREVLVISDDDEIPLEGLNRSDLLERAASGRWTGALDGAFTPDSRHILGRSLYGEARLWDARSGALIESIQLPPLPEGTGVADWDGEVTSSIGNFRFDSPWDPRSGSRKSVRSPNGLSSLEWTGNKLLLHTGEDGSGEATEMEIDTGARSDPPWLRYSSDAMRISGMGTVRDARNGRITRVIAGHAAEILTARFNADGDRLVTTSDDTTVRIWETASRSLLTQAADIGMDQRQFQASGNAYVMARTHEVRLAPDGRRIVGSAGGMIGVWDAATGELMGKSDPSTRDPSGYNLSWASPDGSLVIDTINGAPALIDLETRAKRLDLTPSLELDSVAFSADGRLLATHDRKGTLQLWDLRALKRISVADKVFPEAPDMRFSPDGADLALMFTESAAVVLDITSGKVRYPLESGEVGLIRCVAFTPDGRHLATGGQDCMTRIWERATGRLVVTLPHTAPQTVLSAEFSPDGTMLATAYWREQDIDVWDTTNWTRIAHIHEPLESMEAVAWSPDSRLLTTAGGRTYALCVWHARSGELVARLSVDDARPEELAYAPDGESIITTASRGGPFIWVAPNFHEPVPPWFADFLVSLIQRKIGPNGRLGNLTADEVATLRARAEAGASLDNGRYGEVVRWFLAPAELRTVRPGSSVPRQSLADRLVTPAAGPDQLRRVLDYDPSNPLAHHALSRFAPTEAAAEFQRAWARERLPEPLPRELRDRLDSLTPGDPP